MRDILVWTFSTVLFVGCGGSQDTKDKVNQQTHSDDHGDNAAIDEGSLPHAAFIDFANLLPKAESSGLNLNVGVNFECRDIKVSSIFGSQLLTACAAFRTATLAFYGTTIPDPNSDGKIECEETNAKGGFLSQALCDERLLTAKKVTAIAEISGTNIASTFTKTKSSEGIGYFTRAANAKIYPMDIQFWKSVDENYTNFMSASFSDATSFTMHGIDKNSSKKAMRISYRRPLDVSECANDNDACVFQETYVPFDDDSTSNSPSHLFVRSYADAAEKPNFMLVEGIYLLSEKKARRFMSENPNKTADTVKDGWVDGRSVYFQVVAKGDELWGKMLIRDEGGAIVEGYGSFQGIAAVLAKADGHCTDDRMKGKPSTRAAIDGAQSMGLKTCNKSYLEYSQRFVGEEQMRTLVPANLTLPEPTSSPPASGLTFLE